MATLDDLEADLRAAWTRDNLQVYGDHLQAIGDARGELISVDLHQEEHGASADLAHRRRRAIRAWLGMPPDAQLRGVWARIRFAYGFVEELELDEIAPVLESPAGRYVRSVRLRGKIPEIAAGIAQLAASPRPWLQRIAIGPRYLRDPEAVWTDEPPRLPELAALVTAAPRLEQLDVHGHRLIGEIAHPGLRTLRVQGYDAMRAIVDARAPLPSVERLVLGLAPREQQPRQFDVKLLPSLAGLPALRELDLGPNESEYRDSAVHAAAFELLLACAPIARLERVRVPQIRSAHENERVQRALDRMPELRELAIARRRPPKTELSHPSATIAIDPVPWPPLTSSRGTGWIDVRLPSTRGGFSLWIPTEIHRIAETYERLDPRSRASWAELWELVEGLADCDTAELGVQTMRDALDTMKLDPRTDHAWIEIRSIVRRRVASDRVTLTRRQR